VGCLDLVCGSSIDGSFFADIPFDELPDRLDEVVAAAGGESGQSKAVYFICRRGNDSQLAVNLLLARGLTEVYDIQGGYAGWRDVDPDFPIY